MFNTNMDIKCKICNKKIGEVKNNINLDLAMVCGDCQDQYWKEQKEKQVEINEKKEIFNKILDLQETDIKTLQEILNKLKK